MTTADLCKCGHGQIITWDCDAKGKRQPFHSFRCPKHPSANPQPRHCRTCTCKDRS